ncbi:MAG: UDP-N-acetylmuramate dehydrogenase [bacterium]|nr:UDP-N-acetylmuramate dehydrogenase [bacterium]
MSALLEAFGTNLEFSRALAPLTSFKTGGRARYFVSVGSADEAVRAIKAVKRLKIPCFVMASGSNLLVSDEGFDGIVIKMDVTGLQKTSETEVDSGAGEDLMALVDLATASSLTGLEFAAGIWGTVGGAVYGNAGAFGGEIGAIVTRITVVDDSGQIKTMTADDCGFAYRHSALKDDRFVIISARFGLTEGDSSVIQARVDEILAAREGKHPTGGRSAGCFFKNIPDPKEEHGKLPAGRLLEEAGAKELRVGGASVFDKHANIIVNSGNASSKDIRQLADMMKKRVFDRFGIELQEEVRQLGSF